MKKISPKAEAACASLLLLPFLFLPLPAQAALPAPSLVAPWAYSTCGAVLPRPDLPVKVFLLEQPDEGLAPGLELDEVEDALRQAVEAWNGPRCAPRVFRYGGRRVAPADLLVGEVEVRFGVPGQTPGYPASAAGTVGYTTPCGGSGQVGWTLFLNALESRLGPEPDPLGARWEPKEGGFAPVAIDVGSVLTHELGHVLGLHHSEEDGAATMAAGYLLDGGMRTLAADDVFGLCGLYPSAGAAAPDCWQDTDCGPGAACVEREGLRLCDEERAPSGAYCAVDLLICRGSCLITSTTTGTGYCTVGCADEGACPEGFACRPLGLRGEPVCALAPPQEEEETACGSAGVAREPATAGPPWLLMVVAAVNLRRRRRRSSGHEAGVVVA